VSTSFSVPGIRIVADSGSPTAAVSIFDSDSRLVVQGGGSVNVVLTPGLYKVRYSTGTDTFEQIFEASPAENPTHLALPQLTTPRAATVATAPDVLGNIEAMAVTLSKQPGLPHGTGSGCFIFAMDLPATGPNPALSTAPSHPAAGLKLLTFDGTIIADFGSVAPQNGCAGMTIDLDPGSYLLRLEQPGQDALEQTIVTCSGWQTQVLLPLQLTSTRSTMRVPNLENATILMSVLGSGLNPDPTRNDSVDMARRWLARREPVAPVAELRQAVNDANVLRQGAPGQEALRSMLREKFTNPMLGIYATHLLTLTPNPDESLLYEVSTNLKILLGHHPDVTAIDLWLDPNMEAPPFLSPPMLRNSWAILVNRTRRYEALVPRDSYTVRIADRLWGSGAWLVWCTPPPQTGTQTQQPVDLKVLSDYIRKQLAGKTTSQFVNEELSTKNLTGVEASVLAYIAEVTRGRIATKVLADQVGKIAWLGPLNGVYRRLIPSALEQRSVKAANHFLMSDNVVQQLGIPQSALSEAAEGLFQKFGLR